MKIRIAMLMLFGLLLTACAGSTEIRSIEDQMADRGYLIGAESVGIPRYNVNSWNDIDDRYLMVRAGVRDQYLIELFQPCFGLESAFSVGFTTPSLRVDRFGSVIVRGIEGRLERCRIQNIYELVPIS